MNTTWSKLWTTTPLPSRRSSSTVSPTGNCQAHPWITREISLKPQSNDDESKLAIERNLSLVNSLQFLNVFRVDESGWQLNPHQISSALMQRVTKQNSTPIHSQEPLNICSKWDRGRSRVTLEGKTNSSLDSQIPLPNMGHSRVECPCHIYYREYPDHPLPPCFPYALPRMGRRGLQFKERVVYQLWVCGGCEVSVVSHSSEYSRRKCAHFASNSWLDLLLVEYSRRKCAHFASNSWLNLLLVVTENKEFQLLSCGADKSMIFRSAQKVSCFLSVRFVIALASLPTQSTQKTKLRAPVERMFKTSQRQRRI